jgi:hypothetical protein
MNSSQSLQSPNKMPDLQRDPTGRRFIPIPANAKPSDLFFNASTTTFLTRGARFCSKANFGEYLIFISGVSNSEEAPPGRAVYAYVWGPHCTHQDMTLNVGYLHDTFGPQTAERAQLLAAIEALKLVEVWCEAPESLVKARTIVLAFSGNYFLNQVARSTYREEAEKGRDNQDLKILLEYQIVKLGAKGVTVRFWQIHDENRAEDVAYTQLCGKKHLLYKAVKKVVNRM